MLLFCCLQVSAGYRACKARSVTLDAKDLPDPWDNLDNQDRLEALEILELRDVQVPRGLSDSQDLSVVQVHSLVLWFQ